MALPDFETLRWSFDEETGVGRVELDRPDALNALSTTLCREYVEAFEAFARLDEAADGVAVRAVVVSGAGKAFSAGADVTEFVEGRSIPLDVYYAASEFEGPVVAKVDGYCLGGGFVLALDCDFRFASDRSEFGLPEAGLGILATGGGMASLRALAGPSRAKQIGVTGERLDADRALEDGLLDGVAPSDELDERVGSFLDSVVAQPPLAVRATLDTVEFHGARAGAKRYERQVDRRLRETDDHRAAVEAFLDDDDAEPSFHGR